MLAISCGLHLLAAFAPYLIFFRIPDGAALPVVFLIRVVVPVLLGSLAVAVISALVLRRREEPSSSISEAVSLTRARGTDLLAMALVATLLAIVTVLFFGAYGFILLHLFYGPPVAMQILVSEQIPLRDALGRTRSYLRGNWLMFGYLFALALLVGLVTFVVLGGAFTVMRETPEPWRALGLTASQGLVTGALAASIVAAQLALYLHLRKVWPGPAEEVTTELDATPG